MKETMFYRYFSLDLLQSQFTKFLLGEGYGIAHWCQLKFSWAVETAAIQPKPADAGSVKH